MKRGWPFRAWLAVLALGAFVGLFAALFTGGGSLQLGIILPQILLHPMFYWPYPVFGAIIAVLAFYLAGVLRNSN